MNGQILRELPIAVDYFMCSRESSLYFLTHAHADHTVGLTSNWAQKIYCTPVTAKLIRFKLGVAEKHIIPLEEMQQHTMPLRLQKYSIYLTVTPIPASHCPGSCMFLFETVHQRILYTGDFRPNQAMFEIGKDLWGPYHEIDTLYLDNTYCEPSCVLPSRESATEEIIQLCKSRPDCTIFIGISWIGHEELLEAVARGLQEYVVVTPQHMEVLKLLQRRNIFTTNSTMGRVHALPSHMVNYKRLQEIEREEDCIGILPTGKLCHSQRAPSGLICSVPHSNHASFSELWEFVKSVRPRRVRPVVAGRQDSQGMESKFRANMSQFDSLVDTTEKDSPLTESQIEACQVAENEVLQNTENWSPAKKIMKKGKKSRSRKTTPCGVIFDED